MPYGVTRPQWVNSTLYNLHWTTPYKSPHFIVLQPDDTYIHTCPWTASSLVEEIMVWPSAEPMLNYCQLARWGQTSVKFGSKYKTLVYLIVASVYKTHRNEHWSVRTSGLQRALVRSKSHWSVMVRAASRKKGHSKNLGFMTLLKYHIQNHILSNTIH